MFSELGQNMLTIIVCSDYCNSREKVVATIASLKNIDKSRVRLFDIEKTSKKVVYDYLILEKTSNKVVNDFQLTNKTLKKVVSTISPFAQVYVVN